MQYLEESSTAYYEVQNVTVSDNTKAAWSPLEKTVSYYNHLNDDVTIVGRDGLPFKVPPTRRRDNTFQVRVTYSIDSSITVDPNSVFYHHGSDTAEGRALKSAIAAIEENPTHGKKTFSLDYTVSRDDIVRNGGILYLAELDLVINVTKEDWKTLHPYSDAATRYQLIEAETNVNNTERFGYSMYLVSNDGRYKDKYINIGGFVYRVPSTKNKSLRDGVYLCSTGPVDNDATMPMPLAVHYTFEDAQEKLKLYDSAEEADKLGDQLAEREREIKELQVKYRELEHELKIERMEFEQEIEEKKREYERVSLDRQREQSNLEHERTMRGLRDKAYYESRSLARKDSSEVVKFIPTIITGTLALAVLLFKYKQ
jgi:hypothetical protein